MSKLAKVRISLQAEQVSLVWSGHRFCPDTSPLHQRVTVAVSLLAKWLSVHWIGIIVICRQLSVKRRRQVLWVATPTLNCHCHHKLQPLQQQYQPWQLKSNQKVNFIIMIVIQPHQSFYPATLKQSDGLGTEFSPWPRCSCWLANVSQLRWLAN